MTVNFGQSPFAHPLPEGFKAVIAASTGGIAVPQPRVAEAAGGEEAGDDDEGGPRAPVNLEEFSCATDLADRFGPNRLKVRVGERREGGWLVSPCFPFTTSFDHWLRYNRNSKRSTDVRPRPICTYQVCTTHRGLALI